MLIHCGSPWRRLYPHVYMHIWLSMTTCLRSPHPCSLLYLTSFLQWLSFPWLLIFKPVLSLTRSPTQSSPMGYVYFLTKVRNPGLPWTQSLEVWSNSWGCCVAIQNSVSFPSLLMTEPLQKQRGRDGDGGGASLRSHILTGQRGNMYRTLRTQQRELTRSPWKRDTQLPGLRSSLLKVGFCSPLWARVVSAGISSLIFCFVLFFPENSQACLFFFF